MGGYVGGARWRNGRRCGGTSATSGGWPGCGSPTARAGRSSAPTRQTPRSWERRVAEATGPLWPLARPFVEAWRHDSTLPLARSMESHFRGSADAVPADDAEAIEAATAAIRGLLRQAGLTRLRLYRGQPAGVDWKRGEEIDLLGRGLTAWSSLREIAIGHAARRRPGAVLVTDASVDQVALAFDPSSDAEIVLLGVVTATIDTLIP